MWKRQTDFQKELILEKDMKFYSFKKPELSELAFLPPPELLFRPLALFVSSTPPAFKVHCLINGLENSSSPEYSKVQHLFGIAVGVRTFSRWRRIFFCYSRT